VNKIFELIGESCARSSKAEKLKMQYKSGEASVPSELKDEEEDDVDDAEHESQCRRNYEEMMGAVMSVAPEEFMQCLPRCAEHIKSWLGSEEHKVLALYLSCDIIKNLKEQSESVWPVFMPQVLLSLSEKDPEARTAAAYAINLAAPLSNFAQAAPEAFQRLGQIVGGPKPKKRDEKAKLASDNAVAALFVLTREKPQLCPPEVQAWQLILSRLPLKDDEEEAKKVHEALVTLVIEEHQGVLGVDRGNIAQILSILAEVYHVENMCNPETETKILQIFTNIPRDILQACAARFSEKQQKKIEKMLTA